MQPENKERTIAHDTLSINVGHFNVSCAANSSDIYEALISDKNIKNSSPTIVYGIFLYTDEDIEIVKYIREN
ncbi:hypothetical protein, partial [Limnofasciculus baicalensis]